MVEEKEELKELEELRECLDGIIKFKPHGALYDYFLEKVNYENVEQKLTNTIVKIFECIMDLNWQLALKLIKEMLLRLNEVWVVSEKCPKFLLLNVVNNLKKHALYKRLQELELQQMEP